MTIETNKQIVLEICKGLSERNVDAILEKLASDVQWTLVGRPDRFAFGGMRDKAGVKELLTGFFSGFDSFAFNVEALTAEGDRVIVEARSAGKGPGRKTYKNNYLMGYQLRDGKVINVKEYLDPFEVLDYVEQSAD